MSSSHKHELKVLEDLTAFFEDSLDFWLTLHHVFCPTCRENGLGCAPCAPINYDLAFRILEVKPELIEQARQRRAAAEKLRDELLGIPPEQWRRPLRRARFQSPDFVELLLEESQSRQLTDPGIGKNLATFAARLARRFQGEKADAVAGAAARAFCLEVNALRLAGDLTRARRRLRRPVVFEFPEEKAAYLRTEALVRWERGEGVVAVGQLCKAGRLFRRERLYEEEGTCRALLGLVLADDGEIPEALRQLDCGWSTMDHGLRPATSLRVALGLASCLAVKGHDRRARSVLREAWGLYRHALNDPDELLRLHWREALVLARLGDREEALPVLEAVFQDLLQPESRAEALLAGLDFAAVLVACGRSTEVPNVQRALESTQPDGLSIEAMFLFTLLAVEPPGSPLADELVALGQVSYRRLFRLHGHWIKPFPFA